MTTQINRKAFLQASLATTLVGLVGCSDDGTGGGDGDIDMGTGGDMTGTGGAGTGGAGTGGAGTGGAGTGGAGTGGGAATGGDSATGGAGTGGDSATGGAATGGDTSTGGGSGLTCTADINITSSGGHTHTLLVTAAMLNAGAAVTLTSSSTFGHAHDVALTADEIATIKAGGVVKKFTCDGGDHEYVISCDPAAPAPTEPDGSGLLVGFC